MENAYAAPSVVERGAKDFGGEGPPHEEGLPLVPIEVVVQFVLPHAFDSFAQALELMLLCSHAYDYATSRCAFWEAFLWRRFHRVVIPRLEVAYHRYAPNLIHLLRTKYVMWPECMMKDESVDVMTVVRSKAFVAEQVRDLSGDLKPTCCKRCHLITTTPWWRCVDCPKPYVLCVRCRGKGDSPLIELDDFNLDEGDDSEDDADADDDDDDDDDEDEDDDDGDGDDEDEAEGETAEGEDEEGEEGEVEEEEEEEDDGQDGATGDADKPKHTKEHSMQLVVDKELCRACHNDRLLRWCCKTCLERGFFFGFCDQCHSDPLVQAKTEHAVGKGKTLQHDSTHLVEEWQEGTDGCVNRWDIEEPHPKLTFAEAWADRKRFTPLYLLKLYSPTFTGYGSYACWAEDRPSLFEGFIMNGCIAHGIKYTGWKMNRSVYQGSFGDMEGFPRGKGHVEWDSGVRFDGWFRLHALLGRKRCSFAFADGARWEGQLAAKGLFRSVSPSDGLLTLPNGQQRPCRAETSRGRGGHRVHLWETDGSGKWIVDHRLRGVLEPVDEFADYEDDGYNEEWSDEEQTNDDDDNKDKDKDDNNDEDDTKDSTNGIAVSSPACADTQPADPEVPSLQLH